MTTAGRNGGTQGGGPWATSGDTSAPHRGGHVQSDEELMARVQRDGDACAFAQIYDRHASVAYGLAVRIAGYGRGADVTQDAFLTLWRSRHSYRSDRGAVRTWLVGIVRHRAIDAIRRDRVRLQPFAVDGSEPAPDRVEADGLSQAPLERLIDRDEARRARDALATIPNEQRAVIELAYFGGRTHADIAKRFGLPLGTVKGRMRLGLERMRRHLDWGAG